MNRKTLNTIIPIVSVGVMVVWGTIAKSYEHSWLAVFIGGILMVVVNTIFKGQGQVEENKIMKHAIIALALCLALLGSASSLRRRERRYSSWVTQCIPLRSLKAL